MTEPKNVTKVRCFMGLVTHLGKYLPNLAERSKLLRDRLNKYTSWYWGPQQCKAFTVIKKGAVNPTLPGFADASSYGLGGGPPSTKPRCRLAACGIHFTGSRDHRTALLYAQIEKEVHAGHQGITKCRARAKCSVWWPGLSRQLQKTRKVPDMHTDRHQPP